MMLVAGDRSAEFSLLQTETNMNDLCFSCRPFHASESSWALPFYRWKTTSLRRTQRMVSLLWFASMRLVLGDNLAEVIGLPFQVGDCSEKAGWELVVL